LTVLVHPIAVGGRARVPPEYIPPWGPLPAVVARVSGPESVLHRAGEGLPHGAARAEAVAIRARRGGAELRWGEPDRVEDSAAFVAYCRARGRSAVEVMRSDPSLVPETQIGSWFDAGYRRRIARRAALLLPDPVRGPVLRSAGGAFWSGVRARASTSEWQALTRSSYVALLYHRLAGDGKPGQEKLDVAPKRFAMHLRLLRRLGFHPLTAGDLLAFHSGKLGSLPERSFALTFDDGTADCREPLLDALSAAPQLFVPTAELGGRAHWLDGERVLGWEEVAALAEAGVAIGAHGRRHRRLEGLEPQELADELEGSLADLRAHLAAPLLVVAYPHGSNDELVRMTAWRASFQAAYSTEKGRNGRGTNRYALRRISVYGYDGRVALLWKASTGEAIPNWWEAWRGVRRRLLRRARRPRALRSRR
jgi:peptidoglycan/xylan/chitin deacetylase (PgdA/CDA1 family)